MALYITEDGRVQSFEAQVKSDGSVRPRNYGEFSGRSPAKKTKKHSYKRKNGDSDYGGGTPSNRFVRKEQRPEVKNPITDDAPQYTPLAALRIQMKENEKSRKEEEQKKRVERENQAKLEEQRRKEEEQCKERGKRILEASKLIQKANEQHEREYRTMLEKEAKQSFMQAFAKMLNHSSLSDRAKQFIRCRVTGIRLSFMLQKLRKKIERADLKSEESEIIRIFESCNDLAKEKRTKLRKAIYIKESSVPVRTRVIIESEKPKPTMRTEIVPDIPQGGKWYAGNIARTGPAPRFGYARNYFGRIQERDSYREDRPVNPYSTDSSYDREDDNESLE